MKTPKPYNLTDEVAKRLADAICVQAVEDYRALRETGLVEGDRYLEVGVHNRPGRTGNDLLPVAVLGMQYSYEARDACAFLFDDSLEFGFRFWSDAANIPIDVDRARIQMLRESWAKPRNRAFIRRGMKRVSNRSRASRSVFTSLQHRLLRSGLSD